MKACLVPPAAPLVRGASARNTRHPGAAALAVAVALIAYAGGATAEVIESVSYKTYAVRQSTGTLRESMNSASPVRRNGEVFHAYTDWNLRWTFRWFEERGGRCTVTAATSWLDA